MQSDLIVLDGGMGKHLERSGAPFRQPEWSALALLEDPAAVLKAHTDYINVGAEVIITNAYAVVPFHIGHERFRARGFELAELAGRLAREAADVADRPVRVAGSLPPLFGSYEPERFRPEEAPPLYDVLVKGQRPYIDLWIGETVSSIAEAEATIAAVDRSDPGRELWMSFTVPDEPPGSEVRLRSGETVADAIAAVEERVSAVLFNCSPPEAISVALGHAHKALGDNQRGIKVGAYANAFEPKEPGYAANEVILDRRDELTPERYLEIVEGWIGQGASIVGGCCQMYPEHIEALSRARRWLEPAGRIGG